ncbi:substrate of the Dot/Icm secretion system [Legionella steigerwaltii]|uniref:Substrate of the Dot/Icm secretion system n=1 Tax=Legionella steigerwaltii TaxID=460 RepID=A0A378L6A5_9GAMM|nr:RhoGAP domain-containing protein [Legionella steigerwaltii]KTD80555.1 hypothetical protein Lstg_0391 [Legionella steigerwaltii]STY22605.1 substrate of the Dot/Icm secretion system [Legionella steigerwaltii]
MTSKKLSQNEIKNLQDAALTLIKLIEGKLKDTNNTDIKEGIFRTCPYSDARRKELIGEIEEGKTKINDQTEISLAECAQLLKGVLGTLKDGDNPLFSSSQFQKLKNAKKSNQNYLEEIKNILKVNDQTKSNLVISFLLFKMLGHVAQNTATRMPSKNLGSMLSPNLFKISNEQDLTLINERIAICTDIIDHVSMIDEPELSLRGTHYEAEVKDSSKNRFHLFNAQSNDELDPKYKGLKGDFLKSQILLDFKKRLENATSENFDRVVDELKAKPEYEKVLAVSQGLVTWFFKLDTSSVKAFREMVAERRRDLELEKSLQINI